jgi:hypothetical protein
MEPDRDDSFIVAMAWRQIGQVDILQSALIAALGMGGS